jgi:hypothetical protein
MVLGLDLERALTLNCRRLFTCSVSSSSSVCLLLLSLRLFDGEGKERIERGVKDLRLTLSELPRLFLVFVLLGLCAAVKPVFAAPNAVIQNDTSYVDISGFYHVVGEVKNTGDVWLQFIQVSASFKDQNGVVLDIKPATPWLLRLPTNTAAGFDAIELNTTLAAKIRSYSLVLTYQPAQPISILLRVGNLTSSKNALGWLQVQGQVANVGDSVSENTIVTGTFYGADGKVVYVAFTSPTQATIQPGTSQPFTLSVVDTTRVDLVNTYSVAAESSQYVSVAEFPWQPAVILGVVLLFGLFVLRKRPAQ